MSIQVKAEEAKRFINLIVIGRDGNGKSSVVRSIVNATKCFNKAVKLNAVECESVGDLAEDLPCPIENVVRKLEESIKLSERGILALAKTTQTVSTTFTKDTHTQAIDDTKDNEKRLEDLKDSSSHINVVELYNIVTNMLEKHRPSGGVVAFLFVLKFGVRFTKQEKDAVKAIKQMLGEEVFKKWVIIIFTYGDLFTVNNDEDERHFLDWCKEQTGDIHELFVEVDYRIVLFDNKTKDLEIQEEQVGNLLNQVKSVVCGNSFVPYRTLHFNKAEYSRQILIPYKQRYFTTNDNRDPPKKYRFWILELLKRSYVGNGLAISVPVLGYIGHLFNIWLKQNAYVCTNVLYIHSFIL